MDLKILSVLKLYDTHNETNDNILFSAQAQDTGVDCYSKCGYQQGPCKYCWESSLKPLCCTKRKDFEDTSCGCDGNIGGLHVHECVAAPLIGKKQFRCHGFITNIHFNLVEQFLSIFTHVCRKTARA